MALIPVWSWEHVHVASKYSAAVLEFLRARTLTGLLWPNRRKINAYIRGIQSSGFQRRCRLQEPPAQPRWGARPGPRSPCAQAPSPRLQSAATGVVSATTERVSFPGTLDHTLLGSGFFHSIEFFGREDTGLRTPFLVPSLVLVLGSCWPHRMSGKRPLLSLQVLEESVWSCCPFSLTSLRQSPGWRGRGGTGGRNWPVWYPQCRSFIHNSFIDTIHMPQNSPT